MKQAIIVVLLFLSSCGPQNDGAAKAQQESIKACREEGGIPVVSNWGIYLRCEFPLKEKQK